MSEGLVWQALPRVHIQELSYERFLREFALPKQPFILEGASAGWKAASRWADLSYLAERVNPKQKVSYTTCSARYKPEQEKETHLSAREALKRLRPPAVADLADLVYQDLEGLEPEPEPELPVRYIKTWDYVRGGAAKLQEDIVVPSIFDRSPDALSQQAVLGNSATDMKWLYIGEPGTGSGTHIDTNNSSAWLWVARGAKRWRCIHGGDFHLFASEGDDVSARSSSAEDDSSEDGYGGPPLPDLFEPNVSQFPQLRKARLFEGEQREGDICFNPTQCIHAVHNTRFTVSLTHNYVDATNLGDALVDVVETFEEVRSTISSCSNSMLGRHRSLHSTSLDGDWLFRFRTCRCSQR